jgi:DNA-binding XRE family transcriptional regulator
MPGPASPSTATSPNLGAPGDAETGAQMRRALGQQLAAMRNRAGLSQWELAPLTGYSRSTLSDAELGRHRLRREFWLRCDELLKADSRLVASYDRIEAAAAIMRQRARSRAELARDQDASARLQAVRPAPAPVSAADETGRAPVSADGTGRGPAGSLAAMAACPHCHRPIAVLVVPAAAGPGRRA